MQWKGLSFSAWLRRTVGAFPVRAADRKEGAGSIPVADNMAAAADPMLAAGSMPAVVRAADNYYVVRVVVVVVEAVVAVVAASAAGPSSGACRSYCKSVPRILSVLYNYYNSMFVALIRLPGEVPTRHLLSMFD